MNKNSTNKTQLAPVETPSDLGPYLARGRALRAEAFHTVAERALKAAARRLGRVF